MKKMNAFFSFILHPVTSFFLNIASLTLAVIGLTKYKSEWIFLVIFVIPFVLVIVFSIFIWILKDRCEKLQKKENEAFHFIFTDNMKKLLATLKNCQNILCNSYEKFCNSIDSEDDSSPVEEHIHEENYKEFYRDIKKASDALFSTVVESLKHVVEYNMDTINDEQTKISVCIKQLNRSYKKQGGQIPNDLQAYAIFRDKNSYEHSREIGHAYTVNANTTFRSCIQADNPREACYIENNIPKALQNGTYDCENKAELLSKNTYTATMVVPITQNRMTDKYFYGFLCIDTISRVEDIFIKENLHSLLQCYSDVLATYYHIANTYFPIIFDYFYQQINEKRTETQ